LWEKEIRRARKETFKSQSAIVKLQEELKSARSSLKSTEEGFEREKERSRAREQEAFQARYEIVGCQTQLEQALERIKMLEQERDAFKSLAKSDDDVAKIAAEGLLPLPKAEQEDETDEFASPKRKRVSSVALLDVQSSAASEAEIEELTLLWQWEKHRADRLANQVDFLQVECHLRACPCMKKRPRRSTIGSPRRAPVLDIGDGADLVIRGEREVSEISPTLTVKANISPKKVNLNYTKPRDGPRRSTIFVPEEGVFRTVSQEEAEALEAIGISTEDSGTEPPTPADPAANRSLYSRTPSVDPPTYAMPARRASLISLLEAPQAIEPPMTLEIPTTAAPVAPITSSKQSEVVEIQEVLLEKSVRKVTAIHIPQSIEEPAIITPRESIIRPHTSAAHYSVKTSTTTTKVPLREESAEPTLARRILDQQQQQQKVPTALRTPARTGSRESPTWDVNNPALTPTMTREQALAQIRERRGRARSAAGGAVTPRKPMVDGPERRDVSAPVARSAPTKGGVRKKT
jgi:hypothetical protein